MPHFKLWEVSCERGYILVYGDYTMEEAIEHASKPDMGLGAVVNASQLKCAAVFAVPVY